MKLIDRIKSKTPRRNKRIGKPLGVLGTVCGAILATGLVVNPIGLVALTVGAIVFGGGAVYNAQKVEDGSE